MGDVSAEPSMEDILSSIKRIIAEEGEGAGPARGRRPLSRPLASADETGGAEENVLELSDPMPAPTTAPDGVAERGVSAATVQSTRGSLEQLSRLMVRAEPDSDGTLEGLVRELLRPMLAEWIDANLPRLTEQMVAREIAKITGQHG